MHDTKQRLSLFWIFALLNYLYADVVALFDIAGIAKFIRASPSVGSDGFSGLDGIPIRNGVHLGHHLASVDLVRGRSQQLV